MPVSGTVFCLRRSVWLLALSVGTYPHATTYKRERASGCSGSAKKEPAVSGALRLTGVRQLKAPVSPCTPTSRAIERFGPCARSSLGPTSPFSLPGHDGHGP
jgi:hypothetical protein